MKIDAESDLIIFENVVSVSRELGSTESVSVPAAAEKAVARNAKGTFKERTLVDINEAAIKQSKKIALMLAS